MAGAAPTAKPAPFLRPLDTLDRGVLLAESALSVVIVLIMVFVAVGESAARLAHITHPILRSASDVLLHGTMWAAFLGASFATRGRKHLAIDALSRLLPDRQRRFVVGIAATLGAIIAFALAKGIFTALMHAAHDATEQLADLRRSGASEGTVDRSYEFQFVIPGGFLLISIRLLMHAFHEFVASMRTGVVASEATGRSKSAEGPYRDASVATPDGTPEVPALSGDAPVAEATATEIGIALVTLLVLVVATSGTSVLGPMIVAALLAAATLAIPLWSRKRKTGSLAPTVAREPAPDVEFKPAHMAAALGAIALIVFVARYGIDNIQHIPIAWGVAFFALMAFLGAPLFTFLGGLALFLWLHGSPDVAAQSLPNSVEDALGPHFGRMSVLPTIPVFTLAGYLMSESKTPQRLVRVARAFLGWAPGGLAIVCLLASAFFTVFSGASGITIVAIGGLLYPALMKDKYPENFSLGLVTTGGALGITIPPCLPLIVYGIVAGLQEAPPGHERLELQKFLVAGLLPGVFTIALLVIYAVVIGVVAKVPRSNFDVKEAGAALWEAKWEIFLPFFLLGGLVTGVFNPSQAAAFTAFYVLIIEVFIYKDLSITKDLPRIIPESMILVGAIFVKLCAATILTAYFIQAQTADKLFEWLTCGPPAQAYMASHADTIGTCREAVDALARTGHGAGGIIDSKLSFLIALNFFLLIVGMLMDIFSAIVVVVPLIAGIALHFNINPYHLGIVFLINLEIGYLMPPMGLNLFIAGFRFNRPVPDLYKMVLPFIALFIVALMVTTYVPRLTLMLVPGQSESASIESTPSHPETPVVPAAVADAGATTAIPAAGDASAAPASDCNEQRENETFEQFDQRCDITGPHPHAAAPAAAPAAPAAPAAQADCAEPRENETFAAFDQRCNITGGGAPAAAAVPAAAAPAPAQAAPSADAAAPPAAAPPAAAQ